jgi:YQGE family putative transporter
VINPKHFAIKEWQFFKKLSHEAQMLTLSFGLYSLADPILWTFVNAFLWRETNNIVLVALYNLFLFAGLPIGFFVNGLILKRFKATEFLMFASIVQGLVIFVLMFFPNVTLPITLIAGFIFGISTGLFWSSKNYLTLKAVKSDDRIYFSSLESVTGTISGIIIPFIVGSVIVFGDSRHLYLPSSAYKIFAAITLLILFFSGYILRQLDIQKDLVTNIILRQAPKIWRRFRLMKIFYGIFDSGAIFVPVLMVLILVGQEGTLGSLQSIASVISAIAIYFVSKRVSQKDQIKLITIGVVFNIIATILFGFTYSAVGVIIYFILEAIASPFHWSGYAPLANDAIDYCSKDSVNHDYSFIFDEELFLNLGRILGIIFFVLLATFSSEATTLRISLPVLALTQLIFLLIIRSLHQTINQKS